VLLALAVGPSAHAQTLVEPELVQPGRISTDRHETFPAIDPLDGSLWFSVYDDDFDAQIMLRAALGADGWSAPAPAWSGGPWGDRAPRFSPDGQRLYISSDRPLHEGGAAGDYHLWVAEREGGGWRAPRPLPDPVNGGAAADRHSSETRAGDLYWASTRPGGAGRSDIYRARRSETGWSPAERLPAPVNDTLSQPDLLVSPDGAWMILVITDHPGGLGGDDLFLSRLEEGRWSEPRPLPAPVNSAEYEYGPTLSPDGSMLLFTSHRRGSADIYRVPVAGLGLGR
jgi:Tol biopolymer transport system component